MRAKTSNQGFTLLECLWGVAIMSVVYVLTSGMFDAGDRLFKTSQANSRNQIDTNRILTQMGREIRDSFDFQLVGDNKIIFKNFVANEDGSDEEIIITYEKTTDDAGRNCLEISHQMGTETRVRRLAWDIESLIFSVDSTGSQRHDIVNVDYVLSTRIDNTKTDERVKSSHRVLFARKNS
ncbi:type II secretion system protein J [Thermoproteota archaeon]